MAPSKPYQIKSLYQPQFPALMQRANLLLPILEVPSSVPGLLAKTAASLRHGCVKYVLSGGVSRVARGY